MTNKNQECRLCAYNIPKTKGGHGRMCNGLTIPTRNRCPEWRITEAIKGNEVDAKYDRLIYPCPTSTEKVLKMFLALSKKDQNKMLEGLTGFKVS